VNLSFSPAMAVASRALFDAALVLLPNNIEDKNKYLYSEYSTHASRSGGGNFMPSNHKRWLTAQQTALELDSTSAEICRLLSIGRLSGSKQKQPGRPGKAQWLVNPKSIGKEIRLRAKQRMAKNGDYDRVAPRRQSKNVVDSLSTRQEGSAPLASSVSQGGLRT